MPNKKFKTIDQQIDILKSRGLSIPNKAVAKEFLLHNNYYRVSGYSLTLRDHDVFTPGATFQNIIDIYKFDYEFRHILLKYIELIEVAIKSVYSYEFTKVYGAVGYLDPANFTNTDTHANIMKEAEKMKDIPLWAFVDLLTIHDISFLYKISQTDIKVAVANHFGLGIRGDEILGRFMHYMTIIRNLCAHGSRLYNRLFEQKPWLNKQERALLITQPDGNVDNAHLYSFVLIMRRLLKPTELAALKAEISNLSSKYPFVSLR